MPSVTGKSQSEAEALIKALGLNTEIQQDYSDTVAIGKVISVNPSEGTKVDAGSTITLVVSLGEENKQVEVPNVIGQDEATAKKSLNDQGQLQMRPVMWQKAVWQIRVWQRELL